jgi:4-amino-4-deoxy-L-arabinose transferase-like glycosyltransferase
MALGVSAVRLLALSLPLELSGDEAYYWEWGRHLAWGYYSKPPAIGWIMAIAGFLGRNTTFGIRVFAVIFGMGSLILIYWLGRILYGPGIGRATAVLAAVTPASAVLSLILTIDAPLVFFWTLGLYAFWRMIQVTSRGGLWGTLLAIALAGGILSKQMMLAFIPMALLFLALSRTYRHQLRNPALWLAIIGSLCALVPTLAWNSRHGWVTLRHTASHFSFEDTGLIGAFSNLSAFVGGQLGILTPVLGFLVFFVVFGSFKGCGERERFLVCFSAPGLAAMLLLAAKQRVQANWPAVFYVSATVLTAAWAEGVWTLPRFDRWRKLCWPGVILASILTIGMYSTVGLLACELIRPGRMDPIARLRGWSAVARDIDSMRAALNEDPLLIVQGHRDVASGLAFHLSGKPSVQLFNPEIDRVRTQYDLWALPPGSNQGRAALIIVEGTNTLSSDLVRRFDSVRHAGTLSYPKLGRHQRAFRLFAGRTLSE